MKAIIFSHWFEAPDELNNFCKSIGYENPDYSNDYDLMFDSRVVDFCEQRLSKFGDGEEVYRGKKDSRYRVGYAGAGRVRDIDTTRKWIIEYNHINAPIIRYIDICVNDYGYVSLIPQ